MVHLVVEARARVAAPVALIDTFRRHMAENGLEVAGPVERSRIAFPGATALLWLAEGAVALRIQAAEADRLAEAKTVVTGHLEGFAPGEDLGIAWTGHGASRDAGARPHNFRLARVAEAYDATPRMRRLVLCGEGLERFGAADQIHVKLLLPRPGVEPLWPLLGPGGQPVLDEATLDRRTYTVRRFDAATGALSIDFVRHGDAGPGTAYAGRAVAGDAIGIMGPGGATPPTRGRVLLAGDETALPAIARALEAMAPETTGLALVEVEDEGERQRIAHPPGLELRWLFRRGAPYGAALEAAVRAAETRAEEGFFAWAACETRAARAIREHWKACGLPGTACRAVAYWREDGAEH